MRSLRRQVVAGILAVELLCALGFAGAALFHEWRLRTRALDALIQGRSDSLLGSIQDAEDPEDNVTIDPAELVVPAEDVYAVYAGEGRLIGSSLAAPVEVIARRGDGISSRTSGRHSYRTLERKGMRIIDKGENGGDGIRRPVTIVYAVPDRHIGHEVMEAASFYVGASLLLLLFTSAVTLILLRKALAPIGELSAAADEISLRALSFEPPRSAMRMTELRPLAETLSAVIGRLKDSLKQQNRFIGDATHELKTAVAVLHSSLQLLLLRKRSAVEYAAGLEALFSDNLRVIELVNRMLAAARFTENRIETPGDFDVRTDLALVSEQVLRRLGPISKAQKVRVEMQPGHAVLVPLSGETLDVLVSNLIVNAIQYSQEGGLVKITVETQPGVAVLTVEDGGRGISPEALPHVFERFYREDVSRSRETGGAGLGLSICKAIVEAASGSIDIQSTVGVGTTVRVRLPSAAAFSLS